MAMTFDQRMNNSMRDINNWTENPPCANIDGVDLEARNAIVALQAQVEALQRGMATLHGWLISPNGGKLKGSEIDQLLTAATDIRAPEFPKAVLVEAGMIEEDAVPVRKSGRKERKPKVDQPASLAGWFHKFNETVGVALKHHQVLYRQARFEQPKIIFLLNTDAEHQTIINWALSNVLDYAVQYGTEEGSEQNWLYMPAAALVEHGLALPHGAEDDLRKG